jgi:integrase
VSEARPRFRTNRHTSRPDTKQVVALSIGRPRRSGDADAFSTGTETAGGRVVLLDGSTVEAIEVWRRRVDELVGAPTEWMLAEPGAPVQPSARWLYEVFMRAAKRAGVPAGRDRGLVLHDLRHWAASTALRDGHDPVRVAARLGHSPETLLRIYAHEIEHDQSEVAASLAGHLDR